MFPIWSAEHIVIKKPMDDLSICCCCNFAQPYLLQMHCCSAQFCQNCLDHRVNCPKCRKVFDINRCVIFQPLEEIVENVLVECKYCKYQTTNILLSFHETNCKKSTLCESELASVLMDPQSTPQYIEKQKQKNIYEAFKSYANVAHILDCIENNLPIASTPFKFTDTGSDGYLLHHIVKSDTLQGIAIKYNVPVSTLKQANKLHTDQIHERRHLKIPKIGKKELFFT